jgi:hypothetical protein
MPEKSIYAGIVLAALILVFFIGKCSGAGEDKSAKPTEKQVISKGSGSFQFYAYPVYVESAAKIIVKRDTTRIVDSVGNVKIEVKDNKYAAADTALNVPVMFVQKDSLNGIDTSFTRNLRLELQNRYRFTDSTFITSINMKIDPIVYQTQVITNHVTEPLHWTRSDAFILGTNAGSAVAFFILGFKAGNGD